MNENNLNNENDFDILFNKIKYKMLNLENLVISGGGLNGYFMIGVLKLLDDLNLLKNIKNYYGTSIGSFLILFFALDYSIKELINFCIIFDLSILIKDNIDDI